MNSTVLPKGQLTSSSKAIKKLLPVSSFLLVHGYREGLHITSNIGDGMGNDDIVLVVEITLQMHDRHALRHIQHLPCLGGTLDDPQGLIHFLKS